MYYFESGWKTYDGIDIFVRGWEPDLPPRAVVCLLHGIGEHSGRYGHVAAALTAAGYAVLTFDLRGHGRSQGKRGHSPTYDALLDDITLLVDAARLRHPNLKCFLYGHSLGGNLVINYVLKRKPELSGVIASSPLILPTKKPPAWKTVIGRITFRIWPSLTLPTGIDPRDLSRDQQVIRNVRDDTYMHPLVSARLGIGMLEAGEWALENAALFLLPLLIMHGSADNLTSADASCLFVNRAKGDSTFKLFDGHYHELHNEPQKDEVFDVILGWLETHMAMA